jgi:hypothetical protein
MRTDHNLWHALAIDIQSRVMTGEMEIGLPLEL